MAAGGPAGGRAVGLNSLCAIAGTGIQRRTTSRRTLVTGGAGFVGSHLADALVALGDRVIILDDLSTGRLDNVQHLLDSGEAIFVEGSTLDEALVDELMRKSDRCFHLASAVGVELVLDRPLESLLRNVRGVDVATAVAARHRRRLLFASTSEIYGKRSDGLLHESADRLVGAPTTSRWSYSTAKVFGEMLAYGYAREHGSEMIVVRLFNTIGPRQTAAYGMVLPRFVRQALMSEALTVHGDGRQTRCFGHVEDAVNAMLRLAASDTAIGEVFNVGGRDEVTIVDLARRVVERTGSDSEIRFVPYQEAFGEGFEELGKRKPDTTALEALTGWKPTRTIDDAIDDAIVHQQQQLTQTQRRFRPSPRPSVMDLPEAAREAAFD
jgi:UDP-glucose 4-epimerase